jgi:hypothetical protein
MVAVGCAWTCTPAQEQLWEQTIINLLPVIAESAVNVATVIGTLKGGTVNQTDVAAINTWSGNVKTLTTDFQAAITAYEKGTGTLDKINALATSLQSTAGSILPALQVKDPKTLTTLTAAISLITTTVSEVVAAIPTIAGPKAAKAAKAHADKLSTKAQYKVQWNAAVSSNPDFAAAALK